MHEGHRNRLYTRILEDDDTLKDVELVEFFLCFTIPRIDVRPIAERLLDCYGSIRRIIEASPESMLNIEGVGKKTAASFKLLGKMMDKYYDKPVRRAYSVFDSVNYIRERFRGCRVEKFIAIYLGENGEIISQRTFSDYAEGTAGVFINEILADVIAVSPVAVVVAHNHLSGNVAPSEADDATTRKLFIALDAQSVILYDHLIVSDVDFYSYHNSRRLERIREKVMATVL